MNFSFTLIGIGGAVAIGAMSPGPSFLMVARTAVASTRGNGLAVAMGMGIGALVFAIAALIGLHTILTSMPWLFFIFKVTGGVYLAYLGYRIWKGAKSSLPIPLKSDGPSSQTLGRSFVLGLGTQISNPKTAVVYGSIFASLLPDVMSFGTGVAVCVMVLAIETGWYCIVAALLSSQRSREIYLGYKSGIDRAAGGVMALLGIRLAIM